MINDIIIGLIEMYKTKDPFELCDYLKIKIIKSDLGIEIKGFFQRTLEGYEIIHINSNLLDADMRYICAHELGHAILHTNLSIGFFIENNLQIKNKFEIQADKFASQLLLPNKLDYECSNMDIEQLSSYLGVPTNLIKYKYKEE